MESPKSETTTPLANHIRGLRQARGMTLSDLAQASAISRASLSRIENAEVSPTAQTLAKLSSALGIPISQLIAPLDDRFDALVPHKRQAVYQDLDHAFARRNVSPPNSHLRVELVECTLGPQTEISYENPSFPGHEHHFVLLEGALEIDVDDVRYALSPGDCLRYRLNGRSAFRAGPLGARYLLALA